MKRKVINPLNNFLAVNFETDNLGVKYVDIFYKRKKIGNILTMNLGRVLKRSLNKRIKVPKGMRVYKIQNNTPRVGAVTINYIKIKDKKK